MSGDKRRKRRSLPFPVMLVLLLILAGSVTAAAMYFSSERRSDRAVASARRHADLAEWHLAAEAYEEALQWDASDPKEMVELAAVYLELNRPEAAKAWLDRAGEADPLDHAYLDTLFRYAMTVGDYPLAYSLKDQTGSKLGEEEYERLIRGLLDAELLADAKKALKDAGETYPEHDELSRLTMRYLTMKGDSSGMLRHFARQPELYAGDTELLAMLFDEFEARGAWPETVRVGEMLLEAGMDDPTFYRRFYLATAESLDIRRVLELRDEFKERGWTPPEGARRLVGNTVGNMANGGFAVADAENIYYIHHDDRSIRRTDHHLASRKLVLEEAAEYLNLAGDYLYFRNLSRDGALYRIRTSGRDLLRLTQRPADLILVYGAHVYYRSPEEGHRLFRSRLDGSTHEPVTDFAVSSWGIRGDRIWAVGEEGLYHVTLPAPPRGGRLVTEPPALEAPLDATCVYEGYLSHLVMWGERMYFLAYPDASDAARARGGRIMAFDTRKGLATEPRPELRAKDLNLDARYLYFTDGTLHRMSVKNLIWEKIGLTLTEGSQVVGDWLLARSPENDLPLVHLLKDGSRWGMLDEELREDGDAVSTD